MVNIAWLNSNDAIRSFILGITMLVVMLLSILLSEKTFEKKFNPGRSLGMAFVCIFFPIYLAWHSLNISLNFPNRYQSTFKTVGILVVTCLVLLAVAYPLSRYKILPGYAYRKLFHIIGGIVCIIAFFLSPYWALALSGWAIGLLICAERIRKKKRGHLQEFIKTWFNPAVRGHEANFLASIAFATGFFSLCLFLLFKEPKEAFKYIYLGLTTVVVGDTSAYFVGKKIGKHKYSFSNKTLEGTIAGILVTLVFVLPFFKTPLILLPITVAMIIEALPISNSDNFLLPVISAYFAFIILEVI